MSLWKEMEVDGEQLIYEFGRTVTFRGVEYQALVGANPLQAQYEDGGIVISSSFNVRFLVKQGTLLFTTPPKQSEKVYIYGREFTIISTTDRKPSPWFDAQVQGANQ
jgi:hypothetical protein